MIYCMANTQSKEKDVKPQVKSLMIIQENIMKNRGNDN
jgi:hypothetical protein